MLALTVSGFAIGFVAPSLACAAPIFACNASTSVCNGLTYAVTFDGQFGAQQQYSLWIKTSDSYTGNASDAIRAVALSGLDGVGGGTNAQLVSAPGPGGAWSFSPKELSANGCSGGGTNSLCAQWNASGYGVAVLPATEYRWSFAFDRTGPVDTLAHIKYEFVRTTPVGNGNGGNAAGAKVGSPGSWDIPVQAGVPEGGLTLALLGSAFLLLVAFRHVTA